MQVLTNALRVLECVILSQPVGVSEMARLLDLPKSSVQRFLTSLEREGWLARDEANNGLWVQTPRLWVLAHQGKEVGVRALAQQAMKWLWEQTNENIHLTQQQGDDLVVVDKIESTHSVRVFDPIGTRLPLHVSASGKALLAARGADGLESYLRRSLKRFTDESLVDEQALRQELAWIRTEGYSVNRGEWRSEIAGVGVALRVSDGRDSEFGLAISVPTHRLTEDLIPRYGELLMEARNRVATAAGLGPQAEEPAQPTKSAKTMRRRVGLIVPPAGSHVPTEASSLYSSSDTVDFVARGLGISAMTPDQFDQGLQRLEAAVEELLSEGVDAISVMGTSLTFYRGQEGNEQVLRRLRDASGGLPVTTMSTSVIKALREKGAGRVAVVAAYTTDMTRRLETYLQENGMEVASSVNLGAESMTDVGSINDDMLENAIHQALKLSSEADAVLISCGGLHPKTVSERVERATGIPVVSSAVDGLRQAVSLLAGQPPLTEDSLPPSPSDAR